MRIKGLYLLLILQVAGLTGLYAYYQAGLGYPVCLLRTERVDPRDLLRGDYIILNYEISRLPASYKTEDFPQKTVFVILKQDGLFWNIDQVVPYQPSGKKMYLKATLQGMRLVYDLEKYFVPEGKGNPPGVINVEVSIRPDGRAQIKKLCSDGKAWP